jgi:ribose transport system substrate-binding protein
MNILNRDKHPLPFNIAASTLSSLSAAAILGVFRSDFLQYNVPLWSLLATAATLPTLAYFASVHYHTDDHRPRRVFLVIPAFDQKHWLAKLIHDLHSVLDQRGYDLVLKIPCREYSGIDQLRHLHDIHTHRVEYTGGFIIPTGDQRMRPDLAGFCTSVDMPVVFLDVEPFEDQHDYPSNTAFVGYSAQEIGQLAAKWLATNVALTSEPQPVTLVVGGDGQHLRQRGFKDTLTARIKNVQIIEETADFARLRSRDAVRKQLKLAQAKGYRLHAIFCTNDEMALGAVDALLSANPAVAEETIVVGVDGTPQATALIEAAPNPLHATVVQNSYRVSETAVDLLERLLRKDNVTTRTYLPPEVLARE